MQQHSRNPGWEGWFRRPFTAFAFTTLALAFVSGAYVALHCLRKPPEMPWRSAIVLVGEGFRFEFEDDKLIKYFTAAQLRELKEKVDADARRFATESGTWRRTHLGGMRATFDLYTSGHPLSAPRPSQFGSSDVVIPDAVDTIPLRDVLRFAQAQVASGALSDSPHALFQGFVGSLEQRLADEDQQRELLRTRVQALESPFSFGWLMHDGAGWVIEVIVWSVIGLLANTLIALIAAVRAEEYSREEFLLLFPKVVLAPVLSLVVIALWTSGISDMGVTVYNLPFLLVVSFALGFMTESLYARIRDMAGLLVGKMAAVSSERLAAMSGGGLKDLALSATAPKAEDQPTPRNLADLEDALQKVARGEVRVGLVQGWADRGTGKGER